jgi:hypothetical protein
MYSKRKSCLKLNEFCAWFVLSYIHIVQIVASKFRKMFRKAQAQTFITKFVGVLKLTDIFLEFFSNSSRIF